ERRVRKYSSASLLVRANLSLLLSAHSRLQFPGQPALHSACFAGQADAAGPAPRVTGSHHWLHCAVDAACPVVAKQALRSGYRFGPAVDPIAFRGNARFDPVYSGIFQRSGPDNHKGMDSSPLSIGILPENPLVAWHGKL